jgi:hypothetical protein
VTSTVGLSPVTLNALSLPFLDSSNAYYRTYDRRTSDEGTSFHISRNDSESPPQQPEVGALGRNVLTHVGTHLLAANVNHAVRLVMIWTHVDHLTSETHVTRSVI